MINLSFRKRLLNFEKLIGTVITLRDPAVAEIMADAGFDWLWIDMEHSQLTPLDAEAMSRAAGSRAACLARVPEISETWVKKTLDSGLDGVIFPMILSAEQAQFAVSLCRYPPLGQRGAGVGRAHGYGPRFTSYNASANQEVSIVLQIEHIQAVERIDAILAVPGVDAIMVGPYDLSNSLGRPGKMDDPQVQAAIQSTLDTCKEKKIPIGIFCGTPMLARQALERGFTLIGISTDTLLLCDIARSTRLAAEQD